MRRLTLAGYEYHREVLLIVLLEVVGEYRPHQYEICAVLNPC